MDGCFHVRHVNADPMLPPMGVSEKRMLLCSSTDQPAASEEVLVAVASDVAFAGTHAQEHQTTTTACNWVLRHQAGPWGWGLGRHAGLR